MSIMYWEDLNIVHLLNPMHTLKNVSSSLWRHLSQKTSDTLAVRRDFISSNTKKKYCPKKENRGEVCHSWSFKEGNVPWILKKDDLSVEKATILGVKKPSLYGLTLQCCFGVEEHLSELKLHDHLNLLRVCMMNT